MSQRQSGHDRQQNDAYFTPAWVVDCLLHRWPMFGGVYDPACGDGQIIKACRARRLEADGSDIHFYGFRPGGQDFLDMTALPDGFSNIVTNPPYGKGGRLAEEFISHALELVPVGGCVAMLLRADFDAAVGRRHMFADNDKFNARLILLRRIRWTNLDQTGSPSQNHCWFIWTKYNRRSPQHPASILYCHPDDLKAKEKSR